MLEADRPQMRHWGLVRPLAIAGWPLVLLLAHCGPAVRPGEVEVVELPSFTPEQSALFDDNFHPAALHGGAWSADPKLPDRVRWADSVVVARVTTASQRPSASGRPNFSVELRPFARPLAGAPPSGPIRLTLAPDSPSYRLFRWHQQYILGKDVVLFYRRFRQAGETSIHFRAEPNRPDVHLAVQQALTSPPLASPSVSEY